MNGTCYYFHNEEVRLFDGARKICSEAFQKHGFDSGRLYEPKDLESFARIYELAENISEYPTLTLWLGLNDRSKEGNFVYNSNGQPPIFTAPWAGKYLSFVWFIPFLVFLTFGDDVAKILHNLCLYFARQDGKDGKKRKENHSTRVTKIPKTKRQKYPRMKTN